MMTKKTIKIQLEYILKQIGYVIFIAFVAIIFYLIIRKLA